MKAETGLYLAVKAFLESLGYEVKGEIRNCDIVALRDGETPFVVITELKLGFSLELVLQAIDRQAMADEVWVAVPATRRGRDRDRRTWRLCRLLGIGLLAVTIASALVEVLAIPEPYRPRKDGPRRRRVLAEFRDRIGDPSKGGSTRAPIMTAYRQRALACANVLNAGPARPKDLRRVAQDAAAILQRNVYGWFERTERGVYRLSALGEADLARWSSAESEAERTTSPSA